MAIAAREHLFSWAQEEGIDFDARREGILHIYRDRAGFDHAAKVNQLLAQGGLQRRAVTPADVRAAASTWLANTRRVALNVMPQVPTPSVVPLALPRRRDAVAAVVALG